jgi:hypothetical protein
MLVHCLQCERRSADLGNGGDHPTVVCGQSHGCAMADRESIERRYQSG